MSLDETASDETASDETTGRVTRPPGTRRPPGRWAGRALIAVAVVFLGWSGWTAWQAGPDGQDGGRDRDLVLRAGQQQIAALNSMDDTRVDAGLQRWLDASTGPLHDQLRRDLAPSRQRIQQARTSAVGTVVDAAVTALDVRAGSAQIIASVRIQLTPHGGTAGLQRKRYEAGLWRTPGGWKLKSLTAIPVSAS
jgi:Mce-associated membrane protein